MKIGLNMMLWTTNVGPEHFPLFDKIKAKGFDGVEIPVLGGEISQYEEVGKALADAGLQCSSSTAMPGEDHNAISSDAGEREKAVSFMKQVIDGSAALGADVLIGPFYQPLGMFTGEGPTDDEKKYAAETHREMAEYAAENNVVLAVEPLNRFECYFLNTQASARELTEAVDHPNFGVMADTFHMNIEETDPIGAVTANADILKHVHVSENNRGTPGRGHVPFEMILPAIKNAGYDGWYTIEAFGTALPDLAAAARIWRSFFASPEEVYEEGYDLIKGLVG